MSRELVLDSWILIAWLKDERPAADRMADLWQRAAEGEIRLAASVINVGEVFYLTAKKRGLEAAEGLLAHLRSRPLEMLPASESLVWEAARLKARYPIAYADAFAVATAIRLGCPLATGDPELRPLESDGLLKLEWVA